MASVREEYSHDLGQAPMAGVSSLLDFRGLSMNVPVIIISVFEGGAQLAYSGI